MPNYWTADWILTLVLTSNGISVEKMSVSIKLLVLKYCSKMFLKENVPQF
jgi:hypothetical protein